MIPSRSLPYFGTGVAGACPLPLGADGGARRSVCSSALPHHGGRGTCLATQHEAGATQRRTALWTASRGPQRRCVDRSADCCVDWRTLTSERSEQRAVRPLAHTTARPPAVGCPAEADVAAQWRRCFSHWAATQSIAAQTKGGSRLSPAQGAAPGPSGAVQAKPVGQAYCRACLRHLRVPDGTASVSGQPAAAPRSRRHLLPRLALRRVPHNRALRQGIVGLPVAGGPAAGRRSPCPPAERASRCGAAGR
jgi:hypothetical protein